MRHHTIAAELAHELFAHECFAFTGEGQPHSMNCRRAQTLIADAIERQQELDDARCRDIRDLVVQLSQAKAEVEEVTDKFRAFEAMAVGRAKRINELHAQLKSDQEENRVGVVADRMAELDMASQERIEQLEAQLSQAKADAANLRAAAEIGLSALKKIDARCTEALSPAPAKPFDRTLRDKELWLLDDEQTEEDRD